LKRPFGEYYSEKGRPAKPVRLMVELLLLKQMYDQQQARRPKPSCQQRCEFRWPGEKVRELRSPPKEGLAGRSEVALANLPEAL
jgi:hypothetical protein